MFSPGPDDVEPAVPVQGYPRTWDCTPARPAPRVTAGILNRVLSDGEIVERIELPLTAPTMPCFGGRDGRTLFVTSLSSSRTGTPDSGTVTVIPVDVAGVPVGRFGEKLM